MDNKTELLKGRTLGLLGAGNMAEALARGIIKSGAIAANHVTASDVSLERRAFFRDVLGANSTENNLEVVRASNIIILCVKPYQVDAVLTEIAPVFDPAKHLLASICAGISTERMNASLPAGARTVRVMPNTPMLVGLGACGVAPGKNASSHDLDLIEALFGTAAMTVRVQEPMIDAITGLSGSGPAYLFYLVEAMVEAGVAEGFSVEQARALAARTVYGAAKMLEETSLPPEELRRRVTSPNGTTQAAIEQMDASGVKGLISSAVRRAAERSRELGRK